MPDTKLTDLEILTQPADGDVLYIVDVDQDKSKQITFTNLVGTRVDNLSTSFINLSADLTINSDANSDNITIAQGDIIQNTTDIFTLSTDSIILSSNVADLSADVIDLQDSPLSAVDTNKFSFGTAMTVSSGATITQHVTTFGTDIGDLATVSLSAIGGLSGIETNFYPISANVFELLLNTRVNDDRLITIPANTVFTYLVTRNPSI
jgi:hypothetical protein